MASECCTALLAYDGQASCARSCRGPAREAQRIVFALIVPAAEMQFLSRLLCCSARNEATFSSPSCISQQSGRMASRCMLGGVSLQAAC